MKSRNFNIKHHKKTSQIDSIKFYLNAKSRYLRLTFKEIINHFTFLHRRRTLIDNYILITIQEFALFQKPEVNSQPQKEPKSDSEVLVFLLNKYIQD